MVCDTGRFSVRCVEFGHSRLFERVVFFKDLTNEQREIRQKKRDEKERLKQLEQQKNALDTEEESRQNNERSIDLSKEPLDPFGVDTFITEPGIQHMSVISDEQNVPEEVMERQGRD